MNLQRRIQRSLKRTLARNLRNTVVVTLTYSSAAAPSDPNDSDTYVEEVTATAEHKALVHFISAEEVRAKGLVELRVSDAILDFDPSLSFDGMNNLRFVIDGKTYAQKSVAKEAQNYYDLLVGGERMFRTVIVSLVSGTEAA